MPDISKCKGIGCRKRRTCYRYLAPSDNWQSYAEYYTLIKDGECEYYWKYKKEKKRNLKD